MSKKNVQPSDNRPTLTLSLPAAAIERLGELTSNHQTTAQVAEEAIEWFLRVRSAPVAEAMAGLTPRLREVLQRIGEGDSTKRIAARLGISVKTVEMHRTQLMKTLHIHGIADLVRFAIRAGLVRIDD